MRYQLCRGSVPFHVLGACLAALLGCGPPPGGPQMPDMPPEIIDPPESSEPPDSTETPPIVGTLVATLDRAYQGVDVITAAVPAGGALLLELWSDGSAQEDAGNALQLAVAKDGLARCSARLGAQIVPLDSDLGAAPLVAGKRLRLRLRLVGEEAVLYLDVEEGGAWRSEVSRYTFGYTIAMRGRRVIAVAQPDGAFPITAQPQAPAGAFSFHRAYDRVSDWKLYQRRGMSANIPLFFYYSSAVASRVLVDVLSAKDGAPLPGYAQGRFDVEGAPNGRSGQVIMPSVPQGGNYHLRARLVRADDGTQLGEDTVRDVAVGDVFLAIGQSNMAGFGELASAEETVAQVHLFGNDYQWKQASEPMDSGDNQLDRVSEELPRHSLMLRFGKEIFGATGVPVAIIPGPRYATSLDVDWQRNNERPRHRGTLFGSAVYRVASQGYEAAIRGVLFYHGEGSAGATNYQALLRAFVATLRKDIGSSVFLGLCQLATLGVNGADADWYAYLGTQEAQRQYSGLDRRSALAALIDLPRLKEGEDKDYHLSNAGIRGAGARLAAAILARSYGLTQPLPPILLGVRFSLGRRDQIEVRYDGALAGGDGGLYRLRDQRGALTPVTLVRGDGVILLNLPRDADGEAKLSYGYSSDAAANWLKGAGGGGAAAVFRDVAAN